MSECSMKMAPMRPTWAVLSNPMQKTAALTCTTNDQHDLALCRSASHHRTLRPDLTWHLQPTELQLCQKGVWTRLKAKVSDDGSTPSDHVCEKLLPHDLRPHKAFLFSCAMRRAFFFARFCLFSSSGLQMWQNSQSSPLRQLSALLWK